MRWAAWLLLAWLAGGCAARTQKPFATGVDLSMLNHLQQHGVVYTQDGQPADPLELFREAGVTWARLRLFVDPDGQEGRVNSLPYTLAMAKRAKAAGFRLLLDFHYSDQWADPEHQRMPRRWEGRSLPQLAYAVRQYTRTVLSTFAEHGVSPEMVQVGNECRNGILWPVGGDLSRRPERWDAFAELLHAAIAGVRESPDGQAIRVMVHVESGGDAKASRAFFDQLARRKVSFDVIGLSYYPAWQGPVKTLERNLAELAARFGRDIVVVELGAEWSPVKGPSKSPYPPTPAGQARAVADVVRAVRASRRGVGVFYWAPEWINGKRWDGPDWSADWEHRALFRPDGEPLPAVKALAP